MSRIAPTKKSWVRFHLHSLARSGNLTNLLSEAQMNLWTAACYDHYHLPPTIRVENDGTVKYEFKCKRYACIWLTLLLCNDTDVSYSNLFSRPVVRVRHDTSTSNLKNHADLCVGSRAVAPGQSTVEQFARGSTYQKELLRVYIGLWTATSYRPFTIVKDPYFIKIVQMFNPKAEIPSDTTISRDVKEFHKIGKVNLKAFINQLPGAVHIALDGWSSPNTISYLGIVLLYLDHQALTQRQDATAASHGKTAPVKTAPIKSLVLDFVKLTKAHTGDYLAATLWKCLEEFGIDRKVCPVLCAACDLVNLFNYH